MMPGVVAAARLRRNSGTPAWVPDGALEHLDFVDGRYFANGAVRAVGELLGGGFNPAEVFDGSGMRIRRFAENTNWPGGTSFLDDILAARFAAGCVILFEYAQSGAETGPVFGSYDTEDPTDAVDFTELDVRVDGVRQVRLETNDFYVYVEPSVYNIGGTNKVAMLVNGDGDPGYLRHAAACNGNWFYYDYDQDFPARSNMVSSRYFAVQEGASTFSLTASPSTTYVRKMTIYPKMAVEDLEDLTT